MNIFDISYALYYGIKSMGRPGVRYEVYESQLGDVDGKDTQIPEPHNAITIFTASRILSSTISQLPLNITKEGKVYKENDLYYSLRYRMNEVQNNQSFWATLEYHRGVYGNAFVDIRKGVNRIIHPALVTDYDFKGLGGRLRYKISWSNATDLVQDKYKAYKSEDEWVENKDLLHFKGLSVDGIFGLPPVSAAAQSMRITDKASNTIISFYKNRAMSPMALESTINTAAGAKATNEALGEFDKKYVGSWKAGKSLQLPPNTKLTPLAIHFADAELVATMKFTKDEIFALYGIPSFMYAASNEVQMDIEQQSLNFKTFTIAPVVSIYEEELAYKLLSKEDRINDVSIDFDLDKLVESDLKTKANAYRSLVTSGLMSPNEGIAKFGGEPIDGEYGDYHYLQTQYLNLEDYGRNPLLQGDKVEDKPKEDKEQ